MTDSDGQGGIQGLEEELQWLADPCWNPRGLDAGRVLAAAASRRPEVFSTDARHWGVVEQLALGHMLLREFEEVGGPPGVLQRLEALGAQVSPEFAEHGADAAEMMEIIHGLLSGSIVDVDVVRQDRFYRPVGRLWAAAFRAPAGFDHFIAMSASGRVASDLSFFGTRVSRRLDTIELGAHLSSLLELLQAAIGVYGEEHGPILASGPRPGNWSNLVGRLDSGRREPHTARPIPLDIHALEQGLSATVSRLTVKLVDPRDGAVPGYSQLLLVRGATGMYDDYLDPLPPGCGEAERIIEAVFNAPNTVGLYPRVERALDLTDSYITMLGVIEAGFIDVAWRGKYLIGKLMRQVLCHIAELEFLVGRAEPQEGPSRDLPDPPLGLVAARLGGKLRLANYWAELQGSYLVNGMMGWNGWRIRQERAIGMAERLDF